MDLNILTSERRGMVLNIPTSERPGMDLNIPMEIKHPRIAMMGHEGHMGWA